VPTGYETYIYDHKMYRSSDEEHRQHCGPLHNPSNLPKPENDCQTSPLIMVEPCYAKVLDCRNDVWLYFRQGYSVMLQRQVAEQLRDALIKVCEAPIKV
jgi:hypothetical protein